MRLFPLFTAFFSGPHRYGAALLACVTLVAVHAAPFIPAQDSEVVERLPLSATDPSVRRLDSLRKQLAARPDDASLRVEIARRYFDLSMAQGDPRYVGYASAAIAPLATSAAGNADYWLVRGMLQQYTHDFAGALASLARASELAPQSPEPFSWRSAIFMVQARYLEAQAECTRMAPMVEPLVAVGCATYVRAANGDLGGSFASLRQAIAAAPQASPELRVWAYTRVAEMALRLQRNDLAAEFFEQALKLGVTDQFLLGAYADYLLQRQRPREVIQLLADWERSDVLLLRLALAGRAANDSRAEPWARQLRERFEAAARRGDRLHEQEAARFELDIERNPARALPLAVRNYQVQKEPRDAEILLRVADAAKDLQAAKPALAWLQSSGYEDPRLAEIAKRLTALPTPGASAAAGAATGGVGAKTK